MVISYRQIEVVVKVPARRVGTLLLLCLLVFSAQAQYVPSERAWEKTEKTLIKMYGAAIKTTMLQSQANCYSLHLSDSLVAYLCVEEAPSKHDVFEFLVLYSPALEVQKVQVLVYREDYGFEIKSKRWLQQFSSRSPDEVQAISGATISVTALKRSVKALNKRMNAWREAQR